MARRRILGGMWAGMWAGLDRRFAVVGVLGLAAWVQPGLAQQPASQQPVAGGSVTGTIILGDTQHPARFADVRLQAMSSDGNAWNRDGYYEGSVGGGAARTGIDGTFSMSNVAPGDYYVLASVQGYIPERTVLQTAANAGATAADLAAMVPAIHVSAGGSGSVTVTLQRGGSAGGKLVWEDGSPAVGVSVTASPAATQTALPAPFNGLRSGFGGMTDETDDRGEFRIIGLATGDYLLMAVVSPSMGFGPGGRGINSAIRVYAPGVFHKADAKSLTVRAGDDRDDLRMVLNLGSLRTVSGHVGSTAAGLTVLSGRASIADSDGGVQLGATIGATGDFALAYVPPGTYTLTVTGSTQASTMTRGRGVRGGQTTTTASTSFQTYTQTLTVGDTDVTGMGINLVAAGTQQAAAGSQ